MNAARRLTLTMLVSLCAVAGALAFAAVPALAAAPEAPELRVESITASTASFYGVLNPNAAGVAGTYEFLYKASKTGACEGESHAPASPGISFGLQREELPAEPVSGLKANTEYAVCLLAETPPTEKTLSAPFTFTTAPEAPLTSTPAKMVTATTAVLEGTLNPVASANVGWYFDYSTEAKCTENALTSSLEPEEVVMAKKESKEVSELQPNKKYEFCLVTTNAGGAQSTVGNDVSFTTEPAPPKVDSEGTSGVGSTAATLEAQVNPNNEKTSAYMQYSTSPAVNVSGSLTSAIAGSSGELGSGYGDQPVPADALTGLSAGTTYYYQAVATNATGTSYGTVQEFTTPPTPSTDPVSAIGASTATFNGHLSPLNPNTATQYHFDYNLGGTCTGGGETTPAGEAGKGAGGVSEATPITGLQPDRLYAVCLVTSNQFGSQVGPPVSFKTLPETYVTGVGSSSATLHVVLDPEGGATTYSFQYGTSTSYGLETQQESAGSGAKPVGFEAHIQGLSTNSVYHFRVVGSVGGVAFEGADATFTTQPTGSEFTLPDGREYEMVSPPDKHGGSIDPITGEGGVIQSSEDGSALTYVTTDPIDGEPPGNRALEDSQELARRGPSGWSDEDITTPNNDVGSFPLGEPAEYRFFSPDLSLGLVEPRGETPLAAPAVPGEVQERTIWLRDDATGSFLALASAANTPRGTKIAQREGEGLSYKPIFEGASPDLSDVVFEDFEPLVEGAGEHGLYEWAGGRLSLVSVLPGNAGTAEESARLGYHEYKVVRNAISNDGSRVIWSTRVNGGKHLYLRDMEHDETVQLDVPEAGCGSCENESEPVFQTASADGSKIFFTDRARLTADSTASEGDSAADLYVFEVTSGEGESLAGRLTDLSVDPNFALDGERTAVQGEIAGASEDGSYVYFVANGLLGDAGEHGATPGDCNQNHEPGETCNLYVEHFDGSGWEAPEWIATLSSEDYPDWGTGGRLLPGLTARVSPDGRWLAFMSDESLTGYDNVDVNSGVPDEEVYLFDAGTGRLVCASCTPTGQRPTGVLEPNEGEGVLIPKLLVDQRGNWRDRWLAGNVPGWTSDELFTALYQSRYLSDNGRLFFDSPDSLVPADVDGKENVYEFEPGGVGNCQAGVADAGEVYEPGGGGCVGLISSGISSQESAFLDASATGGRNAEGAEGGGDVFFLTASQLAPQDLDQAYDIYDAHECAASSPCVSVPATVAVPPCTTADSCRAAPAAQPSIYGAPASATFSGSGNIAPSALPPAPVTVTKHRTVKCKKNFTKGKRGKCVRKRSKKRAKKSSDDRKVG